MRKPKRLIWLFGLIACLTLSAQQTPVPSTVGESQFRGPNPSYDLRQYGASTSSSSTTGSITSGTNTLTLASAIDFVNGNGVYIAGAGPGPSVTTPGTPTITPINLLNGATSYTYKVIAEDRNGGLTAASAGGTTSAGAATLGLNTVTLTSCVRDATGLATYTSSGNHNLQAGAQADIEGFSSSTICNGVKTIAGITDATHFTALDGASAGAETATTGSPTAKVYACNQLTFPSSSYSGNTTLRYWIYRQTGAGAFALQGIAIGLDPWFQDCGFGAPTAPSYVPGSPPAATQPGFFATRIVSGAGTTTLTLAANASTTVASVSVLHDTTPNLIAAIQAAYNSDSGTVYIPNMGTNQFSFYSTMDLVNSTTVCAGPGGNGCSVKIHVNNGRINLVNPWILRGGVTVEGEPHGTVNFGYLGASVFTGNANPMMYVGEGSGPGFHLQDITFILGGNLQTGFMTDNGPDGGGSNGFFFDNVNASNPQNNGAQRAFLLKGGFDFHFNRGSITIGLSSGFSVIPAITFTNSSPALVGGASNPQVPGIVSMTDLYFAGTMTELNCTPDNLNVGGSVYYIKGGLQENIQAPYLRVSCTGGAFGDWRVEQVTTADPRVGGGTPFVDATNGGIADLYIGNLSLANSGWPQVIGPSGNSITLTVGNCLSCGYFGNAATTTVIDGSRVLIINGQILTTGTARQQTPMANSVAPAAAVSAGGNVPVGSVSYFFEWVDADSRVGAFSGTATVTTTTGNQTVTLTPPAAPAGATGYFVYRNTGPGFTRANMSPNACGTAFAANFTYVDNSSFGCGNSVDVIIGGASILGPNGLSSYQVRIINAGITISWTSGNGVPSVGSCTAAVGGSLYSRLDGDATHTLYVCDNSTHTWTPK